MEHIELGQLELVERIALALGKQPMGQHIAIVQLVPRKLALGKLVVVLELDKLAAIELVVLDKLVAGLIAALVLGTLVVVLELNK